MNESHDTERRVIPESRIAELRKLTLSPIDVERTVAQRLLRHIAGAIRAREQAEQRQGAA